MPKEQVPINPKVLKWAIDESGYTMAHVADEVGCGIEELRSWITKDESKPGVTELKKIAKLFELQPTVFLLPQIPKLKKPNINFRHPPDTDRDSLLPEELIYIRQAYRFQRLMSWICEETSEKSDFILKANVDIDDPEEVANKALEYLRFEQNKAKWPSYSAAIKDIRRILEDLGILLYFLPLAKNHLNGFSIWNDYAPLIAINTKWNEGSRIFTIFHELAHLITGTSSACLQNGPRLNKRTDPIERWCERFSASFLMPRNKIFDYLLHKLRWSEGQQINDLEIVRKTAVHFKVSLSAAVLRFIDMKLADWRLFHEIPKSSDDKDGRRFFAGEPRTRAIIFEQKYGLRTEKLLVSAVAKGVLNYSDAVAYADVPHTSFESWQKKYEGL